VHSTGICFTVLVFPGSLANEQCKIFLIDQKQCQPLEDLSRVFFPTKYISIYKFCWRTGSWQTQHLIRFTRKRKTSFLKGQEWKGRVTQATLTAKPKAAQRSSVTKVWS